MQKPLQAVIFDVDGTLLDTMRPQHTWLSLVAERYGGNMPHQEFCAEFLLEYNTHYEMHGMKGLYMMIGVDFDAHSKPIWDDYNSFNRTHPISPFLGIGEAVKEIHARSRVSDRRANALRLAVNTTKSWADIEVPLGNAGLLETLDCVVTKNDIYEHATNGAAKRLKVDFDDIKALRKLLPEDYIKHLEKPNGLAYMLTMLRLGSEPSRTLAFEDTKVGIDACRCVRMPYSGPVDIAVAAVTWGYDSKETLQGANPDYVVETPQQMVELVGDLGGLSSR